MRKGVSPVVATVLLIAIAVISAVAVWYWVSPLAGPQATPSTTQYGFVVTSTYKSAGNCTSLDIKNSGGMAIPLTTFEVRWTNGTSASKYVTVPSLSTGTTSNFNISTPAGTITSAGGGIAVGSYFLRPLNGSAGTSGFTDVYFTC